MNLATKRLLSIVLVVALCFHFLFILLYTFPVKIKNPKLNFISHLYVYPLFNQTWELFVPAPSYQHKIFVRYKTGNEFGYWQDILSQEIMNHRNNRILGNETRVLLLSNSMVYELNTLQNITSCIYSKPPINIEFEVLRYEINQYLKFYNHLSNNVPYELMLVSSKDKESSVYYIKSLTIN